ncbi:MAG: hypothetical protein CME70_01980 [Halobacteriovorax sp.]|nr:hypothetical protein [Halobacteriovorax sp.]
MRILIAFVFSSSLMASPISFDQALEEIIKRDTTVPQEQALLNASKSNARSKVLSFLPDLTAGYSKQKTYEVQSETERLNLTASVNLFRFGADYAAYDAANKQLDAQRSRLNEAKLEAELVGVKVLVDNILRVKQVEILEKIVKAKNSSLRTAKARFRRGLTPSAEVDKAKVELNNAKARLNNSLLQLDTAKGNLIALLGHDNVELKWPWLKLLKSKKHDHLKGSFNIEERPDFQKANFELAFREANAKSAVRSFFPTVDFSYTWSETDLESTVHLNERTSLLSITIPIFEGWKDVSNYETQKALSEQARYRLVRIKRDAKSEWKTKEINFDISVQTAKDRDINLGLSRRVYRSTEKRFNKGRVTVNELTQDQNRLLESENLAAQGWGQAHLSLVELCHARGKDVLRCLKTQ